MATYRSSCGVAFPSLRPNRSNPSLSNRVEVSRLLFVGHLDGYNGTSPPEFHLRPAFLPRPH